jgi:hypothetical protein
MHRQSLAIATILLVTACGEVPPSAVGPTQPGDGLPPVGRSTTATLAVSIHALYSPQNAVVKPNQDCEYRADAVGGTTPYGYAWTWTGLDSAVTAGPRFLVTFVGSSNFSVKVKVTDAVGDTAVATKAVSVASTGILCP